MIWVLMTGTHEGQPAEAWASESAAARRADEIGVAKWEGYVLALRAMGHPITEDRDKFVRELRPPVVAVPLDTATDWSDR